MYLNTILKDLRNNVGPWTGKLLKNNEADIGSLNSLLHYHVTVYLLLGSFLLASCHQHFGKPIHCLAEDNEPVKDFGHVASQKTEDLCLSSPSHSDKIKDESIIPQSVINSYCFMSTTYSVVPSSLTSTGSLQQNSLPHPGVLPDGEENSVKRHAYYQWVPLVLLLQIILFMTPHWLWKGFEGGLVGLMVSNLNDDLECRIPSLESSPSIDDVAIYFYRRLGYYNRLLGFMWIFCDLLALLNIVGNFLLTDALLGGNFFQYGLSALRFHDDVNHDWSAEFFPLMTKCHISRYGVSGSIQLIDSLCVMSLNVVNGKIFLLLWGWFIILAPITVFGILIKFARIAVLKYNASGYFQNNIGVPTRILGGDLRRCTSVMAFGDCVLFQLVAQNMRPLTYRLFVQRLSDLIKCQT